MEDREKVRQVKERRERVKWVVTGIPGHPELGVFPARSSDSELSIVTETDPIISDFELFDISKKTRVRGK